MASTIPANTLRTSGGGGTIGSGSNLPHFRRDCPRAYSVLYYFSNISVDPQTKKVKTDAAKHSENTDYPLMNCITAMDYLLRERDVAQALVHLPKIDGFLACMQPSTKTGRLAPTPFAIEGGLNIFMGRILGAALILRSLGSSLSASQAACPTQNPNRSQEDCQAHHHPAARCEGAEFPFSRQEPNAVGGNEADNQTERPADGWSQFAEFGRSGAISKNTASPQQDP